MPTSTTVTVDRARVLDALRGVEDPEIHRPITELGMVSRIDIGPANTITIAVLLTVAACPLRERIDRDIRGAVAAIPEVGSVTIEFGAMTEEQRIELRRKLRGDDPIIPFAQPDSPTRVYCVASGKGGVGKSSVTVNLAVALAQRGLRVGVLDADIHGHSLPGMLGCVETPTAVDRMLMPPSAHGVKLISISMFVPTNEPVVWRGPMLHRALNQFLTDVYWSELDVLFIDLPPGTGDIAISLSQLLPTAELLLVTTPQHTAAAIAERAGAFTTKTAQRVTGVIENMSWYDAPDGSRLTPFGSGGGHTVSDRLTSILQVPCPLLGQIPFDPAVGAANDQGVPTMVSQPDSPTALALRAIADTLALRGRPLTGRSLSLTPASS